MGMEVLLPLLICLLQFNSAFSFDCFKCYSKDYRKCDSNQFERKCRGNSKQCYTLRYYNELSDGTKKHGFKKGCVDERFENCDAVCDRYKNLNYNECQVVCCDDEKCNRDGFKDLENKSKKTKRSSPENKNNSGESRSLSFNHYNLLLVGQFLFLQALRVYLT